MEETLTQYRDTFNDKILKLVCTSKINYEVRITLGKVEGT